MAIGDDFEVDIAGAITHTSGSSTYTVLELHRWLQDLADDQQASGDDLVDIVTYTPSSRATDQIIDLLDHSGVSGPVFAIDDNAAEFLFDGSITQENGDTVYSGLRMVGTVESGTEIQVVQDEAIFTSYWGTGLNAVPAANILNQVLIKSREFGADIDGKRINVQAREYGDVYAEFAVTLGTGNAVAAIFTSNDLNNGTAVGTVATWDQFSNTEGYQLLDIDNTGGTEPYYSQWTISNGSTPASPTLNDLFEWTKREGRRGTAATLHGIGGFIFRGVSVEWDYDSEGGTGPVENDIAVWGTHFNYDTELAAGVVVGEYYTFQTSGAVGKLLALDDNGATGDMVFAIEPGSGTVVDTEAFIRSDGTATDGASVTSAPIQTATVGGRAVILADDLTDTVWVQLLSGVAPVDPTIMFNVASAGTYDVADTFAINGATTARTVKSEFLGASTGSNLVGAFGIGVVPSEAVVGDLYTDLVNATHAPPNNVTFTVGGLENGEDYVLVTNDSSGGIDFTQFGLGTTLAGGAETEVIVDALIPTDTPPSGTFRVQLDTGVYRYQAFTSFLGASFAIASSDYLDPDDATAAQNVFISYLDELATGATAAFTVVYLGDRTLFIRVRDGGTAGDAEGIKTFETTAVLGNAGGGTTTIRTPDA